MICWSSISAARAKDFKYMPTQTSLAEFSYDPALMPAILLSGVREVKFTPTVINKTAPVRSRWRDDCL